MGNQLNTLNDLLKVAELKAGGDDSTAAPETNKAAEQKPAPAAAPESTPTVKRAEQEPAPGANKAAEQAPAPEANKAAEQNADFRAPEGGVAFDKELLKHASINGYYEATGQVITDPALAQQLLDSMAATKQAEADAVKRAQAEQVDALGSAIYDSMLKRANAIRLAQGNLTEEIIGGIVDECKVAGLDLSEVINAAQELQSKTASANNGVSSDAAPAFIGKLFGMQANPSASATQQAAEQNGSTTLMNVDGQEQIRRDGPTEEQTRMTTTQHKPGMPDLNHGQQTTG
jgi:hypothetical protein